MKIETHESTRAFAYSISRTCSPVNNYQSPVSVDEPPPLINLTDNSAINTTSNQVEEQGSCKRKLTFTVWNNFKKVKINGLDKPIYIFYEKKLLVGSRNGTKNLHDHFKNCPR